MSESRMKKRLDWIPERERAILNNYLLVFDQSGFNKLHWSPANIQPQKDALVEGILYHLEENDLRILDFYEKYYQRKDVEVILVEEKKISAVTYLAMKSRAQGLPTKEYLNYLLEGRNFLSTDYFSRLQQIRTVEDEVD